MDKKFVRYLKSWKKHGCIFNRVGARFSSKSEHKKFVPFFGIIGGSPPSPLYPRFCRGLHPLHPLQGLPPPENGWKTIDWNSSQLVLMYYWLTFINPVWFMNLRHFFCFDFETNFTGGFFHDSNDFLTFYYLWKIKCILFEKNSKHKIFLFFEAHNFFCKSWKSIFYSTMIFSHDSKHFLILYFHLKMKLVLG